MASRAGRKRKVGVRRQPNGQPYRDAANETAVTTRMRIYGLTKKDASTELAGYIIGRMALSGKFGGDYEPAISAVQGYVEAVADYMRIKHPMMPMPKAMDYLAGRGSSLRAEPSLKTVARIVERYEGYVGKTLDNGTFIPGTLSAADAVDRMLFHEAAFHDRIGGTNAIHAVIRCVDILLRA